ncbi:MAG: butyrate kinase [Solobacterium sp.]|nr:butyrate kinase [Solobacterium sp.]
MKNYRIFIINPGSTSTKLSLFENHNELFTTDVFHDSSILLQFETINDQLDYRMEVIEQFIKDNHIDLEGVDAIVARGGGCCPVEGGIYAVDDLLIADTKANKGNCYHSSMLGVQMGKRLHDRYGGLFLMMDPPVVDEFIDEARITGVKGIYRSSICHALNLRAAAMHHAGVLGGKYADYNFIVCHIDGGISITAHRKGRMIDGNNASGGQGPFSPTRMGTMAITDVIDYMFDYSKEEMKVLCSQGGGFSSHFGTSNSNTIHAMVEQGDPKATVIWNAMIYQITKEIGQMACALKGEVDAIVLTGGLLRFADIVNGIKEGCEWIAPVVIYPGEFEQKAMASGALRVLNHEEELKTYTGKPVWSGFGFEES